MTQRKQMFMLAVAVQNVFTREFPQPGLCAAIDTADTSVFSDKVVARFRKELYQHRDKVFIHGWRMHTSYGWSDSSETNYGYWWPLTPAGYRRRQQVLKLIIDKYRPKKIDKRRGR